MTNKIAAALAILGIWICMFVWTYRIGKQDADRWWQKHPVKESCVTETLPLDNGGPGLAVFQPHAATSTSADPYALPEKGAALWDTGTNPHACKNCAVTIHTEPQFRTVSTPVDLPAIRRLRRTDRLTFQVSVSLDDKDDSGGEWCLTRREENGVMLLCRPTIEMILRELNQ